MGFPYDYFDYNAPTTVLFLFFYVFCGMLFAIGIRMPRRNNEPDAVDLFLKKHSRKVSLIACAGTAISGLFACLSCAAFLHHWLDFVVLLGFPAALVFPNFFWIHVHTAIGKPIIPFGVSLLLYLFGFFSFMSYAMLLSVVDPLEVQHFFADDNYTIFLVVLSLAVAIFIVITADAAATAYRILSLDKTPKEAKAPKTDDIKTKLITA